MKITFDTRELHEALQVLGQVVPTRSTRPVLTHVLLTCQDQQVVLTATDLEVGVRSVLEGARVDQAGELILPASRLSAICHELKQGDLTLTTDSKGVKLEAGGSKFRIPVENAEDFPELEFSANPCGELAGPILADMVRKTSFATATERSRYAINGVHIKAEKEFLILTATDGRRLANIKAPAGKDLGGFTAIVPTRALLLLQKLFSQGDEETLRVEIDDNQMVFHAKRTSVLARLIAGRFPDYENVIPAKNKNTLTIDKGTFERVIRTAALVTSDDSRSIKFELAPGKLSASARTQIHGESTVNEKVDYEGGEIEIRFNPAYLLEGLKACDSDKVRFSLKDSNTAGLIEEDPQSEYKYVVTPINIVS